MGYVDAALERARIEKYGADLCSGLDNEDLDYLEAVLDGEHTELSCAFSWSSSPQGFQYWYDRSKGFVALSEEDLQWLRGLLEIYRPAAPQTPPPAAEPDFKGKPVYAYQVARKLNDLCIDADAIRPTRREIAIAITHMETAAMWLNKAHYATNKEK